MQDGGSGRGKVPVTRLVPGSLVETDSSRFQWPILMHAAPAWAHRGESVESCSAEVQLQNTIAVPSPLACESWAWVFSKAHVRES